MLSDIKDSDYRHVQMEMKMHAVDSQVNDIAERMKVRTDENTRLLEENLYLKEQLFEMKKSANRDRSQSKSMQARASIAHELEYEV